MKQTIRAFALGIGTASLILLTIFFATGGFKPKIEKVSKNEMIDSLKDDGYRVMTESEYISLSVHYDKAREQENEKKQQEVAKLKAEKEKRDKENGVDPKDKDKNEQADKNENPDKKDENKTDDKDKEKEEAPKEVKITIKSGMNPSEISDLLKENGIINDARKFDAYLEKHDYSRKIQLGEFVIKPNMSDYEIAEAITR